jgi:serine/threonine-protein kinase
VEIYDYGHTADGTFYYVMEYLPGLSLDELVERSGPLPPERVVHFLRQVCAGLREAHAKGLIHRDIKPSNVIACERGGVPDVAKLLDFGLVHDGALEAQAAKLTVLGTVLGSPHYLSPEQASGKSQLDARTDIYSLGATAYFLLTGRPPFERETVMMLFMAHASEPVEPPSRLRPDLPLDLQEVVLRCLEKDPAKRFPDVRSLDEALARCGCAGRWTEEAAEAWWHGQDAGEPSAHPTPLPATVAAATVPAAAS